MNEVVYASEIRRSRRKRAVRARTINVQRMRKRDILIGRALYPEATTLMRPTTRAQCSGAGAVRPCPFVGCRYNLYLDVSRNGSIKLNFPDLEPEEMPATGSCALDVAEDGPHTLEQVGELTNITRERIRQMEVRIGFIDRMRTHLRIVA